MAEHVPPEAGKVALLQTQPATILTDVGHVMQAAGYQRALPNDRDTILKLYLASQTWYPTAATTPWQLEGVIRQLQADGYGRLISIQSRREGIESYTAEKNTKQKYVIDKYGVENYHIYEPEIEWTRYEPTEPLLVLDQLFPAGIELPRLLFGKNIIQLPTLSTDPVTAIAGAMRTALSGLLRERREATRRVFHEVVVDLLSIQRDIQSGIFVVMDGTFAGEGFGPGRARPQERNLLLASADPVAIDALSAQLQGIDPLSVPYIRLAHERGLGIGDPREIEIIGHDRSAAELAPEVRRFRPSASLQGAGRVARLFQRLVWNPVVGRRQINAAIASPWGQLFKSYDDGFVVLPGPEPKRATLTAGGFLAVLGTAAILRRRSA